MAPAQPSAQSHPTPPPLVSAVLDAALVSASAASLSLALATLAAGPGLSLLSLAAALAAEAARRRIGQNRGRNDRPGASAVAPGPGASGGQQPVASAAAPQLAGAREASPTRPAPERAAAAAPQPVPAGASPLAAITLRSHHPDLPDFGALRHAWLQEPRLAPVPPGSREHSFVLSIFHRTDHDHSEGIEPATAGRFTGHTASQHVAALRTFARYTSMLRVERVENAAAWDAYAAEVARLRAESGDPRAGENEVFAVHGSRETPPARIWRGARGLDPTFAKAGGSLGLGIYLASHAAYSHQYRHELPPDYSDDADPSCEAAVLAAGAASSRFGGGATGAAPGAPANALPAASTGHPGITAGTRAAHPSGGPGLAPAPTSAGSVRAAAAAAPPAARARVHAAAPRGRAAVFIVRLAAGPVLDYDEEPVAARGRANFVSASVSALAGRRGAAPAGPGHAGAGGRPPAPGMPDPRTADASFTLKGYVGGPGVAYCSRRACQAYPAWLVTYAYGVAALDED